MFNIDPIEIATLDFVWFLLATLVAYYLVPRRAQNWILLGASYFFMWTWSWQYLVWTALVSIANFFYAHWLSNRPKKVKHELWLGVAANVLVLILLKYNGVYEGGLRRFMATWGIWEGNPVFNILFPLGFSYFTLSNIAYLIDVFLKQQKPVTSLLDYSVFIAYFPKLTAGPIEIGRNFLPMLAEKRIVDNTVIGRSLSLITVGVLRKIILADTMRAMVPPTFLTAPREHAALDLIIYSVAYGTVLYNDFAGYTQMVRGASGLFGIELSYNFRQPFFSRNFTELWERWHRTLSLWVRQYIFFPTSRNLLRRTRNPKHPLTIWVPPLLTMIASGFWHDLSLSFLIWGIAHGVFQVYERVMQMRHRHPPPDRQPLRRQWLTRIRTLGLGLLVQPFFYVPANLAIATYAGILLNWNMSPSFDARIWILYAATLLLEVMQVRRDNELFFAQWPRLGRATLFALIWLGVFLFTKADVGEAFIYQGF